MARVKSMITLTGAMLLITGCASSLDCQYDSLEGTNITCHYRGAKELKTSVRPPEGHVPMSPVVIDDVFDEDVRNNK